MKKVLIITYYWPPAGGPGVQRWLKFVKYLSAYAIEPVVYAPKNPTYPIVDASLEKEIPQRVTVLKQTIFEPYRLAHLFSKKETQTLSSGIIADTEKQSFLQKILLFIRGNFFIPDARKFWVGPSVKYLKSYLEKENIETVITSGPPHSTHLIGMRLKKELALKWVADFRDPWTSYHEKLKMTRWAKQRQNRLEKRVLQQADHLITTSFKTATDFKAMTSTPVTVITNGYDTDENNARHSFKPDPMFTLAHIGSLLSRRNPLNLWEVLHELIEENPAFKENIKLRLVGKVSPEVITSLKKFKLMDFVELTGYVSHKEALQFQRQSQVLLLLQINSKETVGSIPGKLFEYIKSKRPILAIGPEKWVVSEIMQDTQSGYCFDFSQKKALKAQISAYFKAFEQQSLTVNSKDIKQYHRKELTRQLSKLIQ